jgi:4-hydroxy-tetrahydrodipicolinate reductase
MSDRTYRVVVWSTGNVGRNALIGVHNRPDLELVGVWVSNPDKAGKDAAELAGVEGSWGVTATNSVEEILELQPDCVVNGAMADDRLFEALTDLERLLRAGINVCASGPVLLQYPVGMNAELAKGVTKAALDGGASLHINGVDPGFANDVLPLVLSSVSERIEEVRCLEILNYATYDQPTVMFDIMGFGGKLDDTPMLLQPGVLTTAWGGVVHVIAAGLGVELDEVVEFHERVPAPYDFEIDSGPIAEGTTAGLHFEVRGMKDGKAVVVLEHVTRLLDEVAPDWPQPHGAGGYRVVIKGEPNYQLDMHMLGTDGDHNTAGLKATAMRLVNAVPAVVEAAPGLVSVLDLPLVTGRGLVR